MGDSFEQDVPEAARGCSLVDATGKDSRVDLADGFREQRIAVAFRRATVEKGTGRVSSVGQKKENHGQLSRHFVATCPPPSAGTRVCTHDTVKLPRQKQLPTGQQFAATSGQ